MGDPSLGMDAKAYYNSGTHASPTWVLIDDIIDASPGFTAALAEIKSRASTWKGTLTGLLEAGCTFTLLHRKGTDAVRAAIMAILTTRTPKELAFMDQAIATTGACGFRFYANLENTNRTENLEEGLAYDISAKGAYKTESSAKVDPDFYIVT